MIKFCKAYSQVPDNPRKKLKSIMTFKSEHKVPMDLCPEVFPVDAQKCFGLETKQLPKFC